MTNLIVTHFIFSKAWESIPNTKRSQFTGVTGLCLTDDGSVVGDTFPEDIFDSDLQKYFYLHGIKGEKWGFHRTEVIRQYPFPQLEGVPLRESIIWFSIAKRYKTRFINKPVRIYKQNANEQLTKLPIEKRAFENIFYAISINNDQDYMFTAPWTFIKMAIQGVRLSFHGAIPTVKQFSRLERPKVKALWAAAYFPGIVLYYLDRVLSRCHRQKSLANK